MKLHVSFLDDGYKTSPTSNSVVAGIGILRTVELYHPVNTWEIQPSGHNVCTKQNSSLLLKKNRVDSHLFVFYCEPQVIYPSGSVNCFIHAFHLFAANLIWTLVLQDIALSEVFLKYQNHDIILTGVSNGQQICVQYISSCNGSPSSNLLMCFTLIFLCMVQLVLLNFLVCAVKTKQHTTLLDGLS